MLVLSRKTKESIQIGHGITITILRVKGKQVRVGIEAPEDVRVIRGELPRFEDSGKTEEPEQVEASAALHFRVQSRRQASLAAI